MNSRRFPPPWNVISQMSGYVVVDATGRRLAYVDYNDGIKSWTIGDNHLNSDEARRIAKGIARLPEFMTPWKDFVATPNPDSRWKPTKPYHVAVENCYVQGHWDQMDTLCKHNLIPFDPTGQRIDVYGSWWIVYEFAIQQHAMMFWREFAGRWLRYGEFFLPDLPPDAPVMKYPPHWKKFARTPGRG